MKLILKIFYFCRFFYTLIDFKRFFSYLVHPKIENLRKNNLSRPLFSFSGFCFAVLLATCYYPRSPITSMSIGAPLWEGKWRITFRAIWNNFILKNKQVNSSWPCFLKRRPMGLFHIMKKKLSCKIFGQPFFPHSQKDLLIEEYDVLIANKKFTTDGYGRMVKLNKYLSEDNKITCSKTNWKSNGSLNYFSENEFHPLCLNGNFGIAPL